VQKIKYCQIFVDIDYVIFCEKKRNCAISCGLSPKVGFQKRESINDELREIRLEK
jgi:hypothetical protein